MTDFLGPIEVWMHLKDDPHKHLPMGFGVASLGTQTSVATTVIRAEAPKTKLVHNIWPTQHYIWTQWSKPGTAEWVKKNLTDVACPWELHMDQLKIHSIQIHEHCANSLKRVLAYIWENAGESQEAIEKLHYDRYSGSYNFRPIRGGTHLSMHSYGLAIDFDDQENQQHSEKHLFQSDSLIVKAFEGEGWEWGGRWSSSSVDAMHFQASRVS